MPGEEEEHHRRGQHSDQ
ncbi:hypothetical protein A2U01_0074885, partial [Trifolium medium]|nr:hypothetical protein [Trifolium medium]